MHTLLHSFTTVNQMNIYSKKVLTTEKIKIVEPTNMIELIEDEYEKFPEDTEFQTEYTARKTMFEERKESIFNMLDNTPVRRIIIIYSYSALCSAEEGTEQWRMHGAEECMEQKSAWSWMERRMHLF
jgi:adenine-specific DNA methylase